MDLRERDPTREAQIGLANIHTQWETNGRRGIVCAPPTDLYRVRSRDVHRCIRIRDSVTSAKRTACFPSDLYLSVVCATYI